MKKKLIFSKDIVTKFNISYPTVTFYTNLGFLNAVTRKGNKRLYNEQEVKRRLKQINKMINDGYPLRLIRKKLTG